ncbi:hypothetical protein NDU88_006907 [Pleurodeles waltl]|uniref:Uncharacterized protein n=1 Tax=Pleurodeles waltl TaxID=8319 RepID=A0AAV7NUQ8_PLEWA|nr:hypothetical protein NDU88_006907 [Pleurodeles waltl]
MYTLQDGLVGQAECETQRKLGTYLAYHLRAPFGTTEQHTFRLPSDGTLWYKGKECSRCLEKALAYAPVGAKHVLADSCVLSLDLF